MSIFCRNRKLEVQGFLVKVLNNLCPQLRAAMEGPRGDRRINLTLVAVVIPVREKRPDLSAMFTCVTRELSTTGVSLVVSAPEPMDDLVIGFRWEGEMKFLRGKTRHINPMGGGFYQLGVRLDEIVTPDQYPQIEELQL